MKTVQMSTVQSEIVQIDRNSRLSSWPLAVVLVSVIRPLSVGQFVQQAAVSPSDGNQADVNTGIVRDDARTLDPMPLAGLVDRDSFDVLCPVGLWSVICPLSVGWPVHDDELFPRIDQTGVLPTRLLDRVDGVFSSDPDLIHVQAWGFGWFYDQGGQKKSASWVAVLSLSFSCPFLVLSLSLRCLNNDDRPANLSSFPQTQKLSFRCPFPVRLAFFVQIRPILSVVRVVRLSAIAHRKNGLPIPTG